MISSVIGESDILYQSIPDIKAICKPILTHLKITQFDYVRDHDDFTRIHFTTNPKWAHFFYQNINCYQAEDGLVQGNIAKNGYILQSQLLQYSQQKVYKDIQQYFNQPEGIILIESNRQYSECYCFHFKNINNVMPILNNMELLFSFSSYFKEKIISLLDQADKQRILIPKPKIRGIYDSIEFTMPLDIINQYMAEVQSNKKNVPSFTNRERQCIECLARDMTAKQTAKELHISHRTVERHLDNAKRKLGLHYKSSLLAIVA